LPKIKRPHIRETSPGKNDNFHPKYLLHLPRRPRAVSGFALFCNLARSSLALYAVPVRQAGTLPPASFRFHLTVDPLAIGYHSLLPSVFGTRTLELSPMPGAPKKRAVETARLTIINPT